VSGWQEIVALNDKHFPGWRQSDLFALSNAMLGELGEYANALKHQKGGGTNAKTASREELLEELVDLWHYMVITGEVLGFTENEWLDAVDRKVRENHKRMEARRG